MLEEERTSSVSKTALLHHAVSSNFDYIAARALSTGANPNDIIETFNALHKAIISQDRDLIELVFFYEADPNLRTHKNNTPLLTAALTNHLATVMLVLTNGARDTFHPAADFPSALYYSLANNAIAIARAIKQHTNLLLCRDCHGGTYLHMAMFFKQDWMLENIDPTHLLNTQNCNLNTPLHIAMKQGYEAGIRFLAHHQALYQVVNLEQETALSLCPSHLLHLFNY